MASNNKTLGELVKPVDERNSELKTSEVLGISINKEFMPSVANIIGTDLSNYKLLRKGRFAFNSMHIGRDEKLPIALFKRDDIAIVSPAYFMFELKDKDEVDENYLMIWFQRPEFDHLCWYMTDASVRGGLSWDDFCRIEIDLPSIEEQRKIVHDYKVITDRIELLKKVDSNLFFTAKIIMKEKYNFGDLFGNNTTINAFCDKTVSGATPSRTNNDYWNSNDVAWLKNGEVKNNIILDTEEYVSKRALEETSIKLIDKYSVNMAMYCVSDIQVSYSNIPLTTNQAVLNLTVSSFRKASFLYYYLATFGNDITSNANGSAQQNLSKEIIDAHEFLEPNLSNKLFDYFETNLIERISIAKELSALSKIKDCLMTNLSKEAS